MFSSLKKRQEKTSAIKQSIDLHRRLRGRRQGALGFGILHADQDLVVEVLGPQSECRPPSPSPRRCHPRPSKRKRQKCHHPCRRSARCRKKPARDLDHRLVAGSRTSTRTWPSGQAPKEPSSRGQGFFTSELGLRTHTSSVPSGAVPLESTA